MPAPQPPDRPRTRDWTGAVRRTRRNVVDGRGDQVAYLVGVLPQGRIGIGWATARITAQAEEPTATVLDTDHAVTALKAVSGPGSVAKQSSTGSAPSSHLTKPRSPTGSSSASYGRVHCRVR